MARDNCSYYYEGTISAINSMEGDHKVHLNEEQCKHMIEAFKRVRHLLCGRKDLKNNSKYCLLLKELYRQTIAAIAVLESCCCCRVHEFPQKNRTEPSESWLEVAVTQSRMVFRVILDDLKWCAGLIAKAAADPSQASASWADIDRLAIEKDMSVFKESLDKLGSKVQERDVNLLAKFLRAALDSNDSEDVNACLWESTPFDKNLYGELVKDTRWLGVGVVRKGFQIPELYFEKEKEIMKSLNHPNVVRYITSSKQVNTNSAIIMERVDDTLEEYLRQHPHLTKLETVDILYQIASAMAYLHGDGVAHCDIKPANLLVNPCKVTGLGGYVHLKIADFGLSVSGLDRDGKTLRSSPHRDRGTTIYRAPELKGTPTNVDFMKADVFSYALTCWQILHGEFGGKNLLPPSIPGIKSKSNWTNEYNKAILEGKRPELNDSIPRLKELLQRCWSPEPEKRPTFSAISIDLREIKELLLEVIPANQPIPELENETSRKTWKVLLSSVKALVAVQIRHVSACFAKREEEYVFTGPAHETAQIIPAANNIEDRDQPAPSRFMLRKLRVSGCFTLRDDEYIFPGDN